MDERSFIYASEGAFPQISNKNCSIPFHSKRVNFDGLSGLIPLKGGKYFTISNKKRVSIIKLCYT